MITNNYITGDGYCIVNNKVYINGKELPPVPSEGRNTTVLNGHIFIDGYEFKNGQWRKTLRALWHKWF